MRFVLSAAVALFATTLASNTADARPDRHSTAYRTPTRAAAPPPRHRRPPPPPRVCEAGELRVSAANGSTWFDVYVDGRLVVESRVGDGQQSIAMSPGDHFVRVTDFMGRTWSNERLHVGCNTTVIADVRDRRGLRVLTQLRDRGPRHAARCSAGGLLIENYDSAWFDVYVNGQLVMEQRVRQTDNRIGGLAPGNHHVRVTDFMGRTWSENTVFVGCNELVAAQVSERRGLRML